MFINVQIPFADLRPFLGTDYGRLPIPGWPHPQVDAEFVRAVGAVRQRKAGGVSPWMGEGYYADAARAIQFPPKFARWPYAWGGNSTSMQAIFRRFFSDGRAVARMEIGFAPRNRYSQLMGLSGTDLVSLVASCLGVPVRVRSADNGKVTRELVVAGRELARHLQRATTRNGSKPPAEPWCVRSLRPIVVAVYRPEELVEVPRGAKEVPIDAQGHRAWNLLVGRNGITVPTWLIREDQVRDRDHLRRIRLHLFRLHAEREVFRWTLTCASDGKLAGADSPEPWDRLQAYLNETDRLLSRGSVYGIGTAELKTALGLEDLVNPGERESLLVRLRGMRGNVYRKVEEAPAEKAPVQIVFAEGTVSVNQQIGDINMDDRSVSIGDVHGSIQGAIGSDIRITNSFQQIDASGASEEVKTVLKELVRSVEALKPQFDDVNRGEVERHLDGLVQEATAPAPKRGLIEALGDALAQTAKAAGEVGLPVVKLVTQLVALFA